MPIQDANVGTFTDWAKRAAAEAADWCMVTGRAPKKELDAFEEGYRQGFLKATQMLRQRDLLKNKRA